MKDIINYDVILDESYNFVFENLKYKFMYEIYKIVGDRHDVELSEYCSESYMLSELMKNGIYVYCDGELF